MKKRKIFRNVWMLAVVMMPLLTGCTQPNGYIGNWFGSWYLEEILIDGEPDPEYGISISSETKPIMVSFQGKVFNMAYIDAFEIYGSWVYAGETLTLNASYDNGSGSGASYFTPFPVAMHFPKGVDVIEVTVTKLEKRVMQWQYVDPEGQLLTYNFTKRP